MPARPLVPSAGIVNISKNRNNEKSPSLETAQVFMMLSAEIMGNSWIQRQVISSWQALAVLLKKKL
ncbi:hypothetical protein J6590_072309 [Homalodisca vitripennis]|nr:hypothetical protein J6590_072309 [Homalodisca vitripennis]